MNFKPLNNPFMLLTNKLNRTAAFCVLLLSSITIYSQNYLKSTRVNFHYNTSAVTNTLIVHAVPYIFNCLVDPAPVVQVKKAVLNALLDWKGDYKPSTTSVYTVTLTIQAFSTYTGTSSGLIATYTPTLSIQTGSPQSYISIDFTGIYLNTNRFLVQATYSLTAGTHLTDIESVMNTSVYYTEDYSYNPTTGGTPIVSGYAPIFTNTNVATFSWATACQAAPNYQFQLLRLYNTYTTSISSESVITTDIDWNKALTVETGNSLSQLSLTMAEGSGYYVWRVRPIGNAYDGGIANDRNWGLWSTTGTCTQGATAVAITNSISPHLFYYDQLDKDRNWVFTRSFVEGDATTLGQVNIGEAISYANGLQMAQQRQIRLISQQKTLVNQTVYDYCGRAALNTLSSAIDRNSLGYIPSYVKNPSGQSYSSADFDALSTYTAPSPMDSSVVAYGLNSPSQYYSAYNTNETDIPTAAGFPFTRTLFSKDGLNRPLEKSSPGYVHRINTTNKHTARTFYSGVSDIEIVRVFGDEAPYENSVYKTINLDANNQSSVSYTSKDGKTIATCLSTPTVSNLDPIPSSTLSAFTTTSNINNNNSASGPYAFRSFKSMAFSEPLTYVTLNYSLTPNTYSDVCNNFCATCDYKLTLKVTDNNNPDATPIYQYTSAIGSASNTASCTGTAITQSPTFSVGPGAYTVERIIEANNTSTASAVGDTYINDYMQQLKAGLSNVLSTGTATLVSDAGVPLLNGGLTYTVSMTAINNYLTTNDLDGLYLYLGVANPGTDTHKNIKIGCYIIKMPVWYCNKPTCNDSDMGFERYFYNWYKTKNPTSSLTNQQMLDLILNTSGVRSYSYSVNELDTVVNNMIHCGGYNCQKLWDCWQSTVSSFGATSLQPPSSMTSPLTGAAMTYTTDYLDMFLGCAGYNIQGITSTSWTGQSSTTGTLCTGGYKSHPYAYFNYATACASCEQVYCQGTTTVVTTNCPGCTGTPWAAFTATFNAATSAVVTHTAQNSAGVVTTMTTTTKNDFFNCYRHVTNCNQGSTPPANAYTNTINGVIQNCNAICDKRFDQFVYSVTDAYHAANTQVQGDPYVLVADPEFGGYSFGTTTFTGTPGVSLATVYCQANQLLAACKSNCTVTVQPDNSLGSATEQHNLANVFSGQIKVKPKTIDGFCPSGYTQLPTTTSNNIDFYVTLLNNQLKKVRDTTGSNGLYWDYYSFLTSIDATMTTTLCAHNKVFVHPNIPSYFDSQVDVINRPCSLLVYYFNTNKTANSIINPKPVYSTSLISAGSTYTYTSSGTLTGQSATTLTPTAYIFDSNFSPSITYSITPGNFEFLQDATNGINPIAITNTTMVYSYTNTAYPSYGYWTQTLCSNICGTSSTCSPICYTIIPVPAPTVTNVVTYTLITCAAQTTKDIQNSLSNQIKLILDSTKANLKQAYMKQCIQNLTDNYTMQYVLHYHHYTLYYYDRAGNLTKTVPPKGVESVTPPADRTVHPAYTYITEYEYNSLAQLVRQKTPDGGETNFQYDVKGKLRFSQNAKQLVATPSAKNSYTKYDALARIIEVGEIAATPTYTDLNNLAYPSSGGIDITRTVYSASTAVTYFGNKPQRYLQNRVSYSLTDKDGNITTTGDQVKTCYSYDPHGNVEWITQDIPELGRNYIGYEYDLMSGSIVKVKYNEQFPDRFFHRYTYDVDKRIKTLETSKDNYFWEKDANYTYYLHGPLKRTLIGHDQIQGLDYAYTIHGWLKSINHLTQISDPGGDGSLIGDNVYVAKDAYGMALSYYDGDYVNKTSFLNASTSNILHLQGTSLYNGNISSWTQGYDNSILSSLSGVVYNNTPTGRTFKYDQLNRITSAQFNTYSTKTLWGGVSDFYESFAYDPNGNITKLLRNGNATTGLSMDSLTYRYSAAATDNKLLSVHDLITSTYSVDIVNQAVSNYTYDPIGNLTADASGSITAITWNVYGKIASLTKTDGTVITYLYDASGNRVYKKVSPTFNVIQDVTTYYIKDASGNSMAVYGRTNTGISTNYTANYTLLEEPIYGSERIGIRNEAITRTTAYTGTVVPTWQNSPQAIHNSTYPLLMLPMLNTSSNQAFIQNINTAIPTSTSISVGSAERILNMSALTTNTAITFLGARAQAMAFDASGNIVMSAYSYSTSAGSTVPSSMMIYVNDTLSVPFAPEVTSSINPNAQASFIKKPGTDNYYYFFTIGKDGKPYYHTIDASMGNVVNFNNLLDNNANYGNSMAILEDQVGLGSSMLYLKRCDHDSTYIQPFSITQSGITALTRVTVSASDSSAAAVGDIQLSSGDTLLAIGTRLSGQGRIHMYKVSTDHQTLSSLGKIQLDTYTNCKSIEFGATDQYMFFTIDNGTGNSVNMQRVLVSSFTSPSTTLRVSANSDLIDSRTGINIVSSIRRGVNNYLYYVTNTRGTDIDLRMFTAPENSALRSAVANTSMNIRNISLANFPIRTHLISYSIPSPTVVMSNRNLDKKEYELKDHLGNVHMTIKDYKVPFSGTTDVKYDERFNDYTQNGSVAGSYTITAGSPTVTAVSNYNNSLKVFGTQGSTVNNVLTGFTAGHKYMVAFDYQHNNCATTNYSLTTGFISSGSLQQDGRTEVITDVGASTTMNLIFSCQDPTASTSFYIDNILIKDLGASIAVGTNTTVNDPFTSTSSWPWIANNTTISYATNTMVVSGTTGSSAYSVYRGVSLVPGQIYRVRLDLTAASVGTSTISFNFNSSNNQQPGMEFTQQMLSGISTYTFFVIPKTEQNTVYLNLTTPGSSFSFQIDNFIIDMCQAAIKPLYTAVMNDFTDYYAFGAPMPGRKYSSSAGYRYGMNGQENDNEVYGAGNLTSAEYWEYDTRLGRRWNTDPVVKPWESPYACFANNPIYYTDVNGSDAKDKGKGKGAPVDKGDNKLGTIKHPGESKQRTQSRDRIEPIPSRVPQQDNTAVSTPDVATPNTAPSGPTPVNLDSYNTSIHTESPYEMTSVSTFKSPNPLQYNWSNPWPNRNYMNLINFPKPEMSVSFFGFSISSEDGGTAGYSHKGFSGSVSNNGTGSIGLDGFSAGDGNLETPAFGWDRSVESFVDTRNSAIPYFSTKPLLHTTHWDVIYQKNTVLMITTMHIQVIKTVEYPKGKILGMPQIMIDTTLPDKYTISIDSKYVGGKVSN